MRSRSFFLVLCLFKAAPGAAAETIIDVSKEWNLHHSSSSFEPSSSPATPIPKSLEAPSTPSSTLACECDALTPQERLEQSTYAFTGTVIDAQKPKKGKRMINFDIDEIFKGTPGAEMGVLAEVTGTDCDLPYAPGQSYLVFTKWEWGNVVTSRCMGTKFLEKAKLSALGPSEALKEKLYIRLRNACMGRRDTACCLSSLKAMREGYHIPEPEEGCPSGSIPDRLRCGGSYSWCIPVTEKGHY